MGEGRRVPQPPGPHPAVVRPAFVLRCQFCRARSKGPGQTHRRVGTSGRVSYYECWHCYDPRTRKATTFKVIRQEEQAEAVRERTERL